MCKIIIKNSLIWLLPLSIYIFEIVFVCINGATLINNICAWVCCFVLFLQTAIPCIIRVCKSEIKYKQAKEELDERIKQFIEND